MPTYEYVCRQCGEHLEVVQSFTDDALTECPNCGGVLKKVFGNIGIVFKGSGFYKTDSRSSTSSGKAKPDVAASASPEKDAGSKGDSSTASKGDGAKSDGPKKDSTTSGAGAGTAKRASSGSSGSTAAAS
jgi:putative FmdB family regulatory protein